MEVPPRQQPAPAAGVICGRYWNSGTLFPLSHSFKVARASTPPARLAPVVEIRARAAWYPPTYLPIYPTSRETRLLSFLPLFPDAETTRGARKSERERERVRETRGARSPLGESWPPQCISNGDVRTRLSRVSTASPPPKRCAEKATVMRERERAAKKRGSRDRRGPEGHVGKTCASADASS